MIGLYMIEHVCYYYLNGENASAGGDSGEC